MNALKFIRNSSFDDPKILTKAKGNFSKSVVFNNEVAKVSFICGV